LANSQQGDRDWATQSAWGIESTGRAQLLPGLQQEDARNELRYGSSRTRHGETSLQKALWFGSGFALADGG
jgi:hypothetical protein